MAHDPVSYREPWLVPILMAVPYSLQTFTRGANFLYSFQFCLIFSSGIFKILKTLFICIITRVDTHFFNDPGSFFGSIGSNVYRQSEVHHNLLPLIPF